MSSFYGCHHIQADKMKGLVDQKGNIFQITGHNFDGNQAMLVEASKVLKYFNKVSITCAGS